MTLTMARRIVSFRVVGKAEPKGSTKAFIPKGWTRPVITSTNPRVKGWQQLVAEQAQDVASDGVFVGPVVLAVTFALPRPKSLPKRVLHCTTKPDTSKLVRAVEDALTGVLYHDDAQVVQIAARKVYAPIGSAPSACVTVAEAVPPDPTQLTFTAEDLFSGEAFNETPSTR